MYIERSLERKFIHMGSFFKAILLTGARQVGKTTMLKHLAAGRRRNYVTMDNSLARELAREDPALFFQAYKPPILIDEIQKAPQLFEEIKLRCDKTDEKGLFWMTGSQSYAMMQGVRESLAGRVGILELYGLSRSEIDGVHFSFSLDFSLEALMGRQKEAGENDLEDTFDHIWRGGMPAVIGADPEQRQEYFNSYIETYLMRDVAEAGGITDSLRFRRFLTACAALTAEPVNYRKLAEAADISQPTAKEWLKVLEGLGIIYLLLPFSNNELKRLTKTPKLYFCDTGLCAYLSRWLSRDTLMLGAASGHYFENYLVMEVLKHYAYSRNRVNLSYYRDSNGVEIDLIVEENGRLHPLEIKQSASPDRRQVKKFEVLDRAGIERGRGGLLCLCQQVIPIDEKNAFIPANLI